MTDFNSNKIFEIKNEIDFLNCSLELFNYQYTNCNIYKKYCITRNCNPNNVLTLDSIPFLPIQFFKRFPIINKNKKPQIEFTSSGTTSSNRSTHYISDVSIYRTSFLKGFTKFYGNVSDYCFLALLPSYLERDGSSLVFMVSELIKQTKQNGSGFYLNNHEELFNMIKKNELDNIKTILIGVSFALITFSEKYRFPLKNTIIMETGGMKGHGKEIPREDLHLLFKSAFSLQNIHSEYGMTELLSQAYAQKNGHFKTPSWMKVLVRDTNDPLSLIPDGKTGGINIIDLANFNSCSFLALQDLGKINGDGTFEVLGRFDFSDLRGCNLMVD